jgi:hypothetical protein
LSLFDPHGVVFILPSHSKIRDTHTDTFYLRPSYLSSSVVIKHLRIGHHTHTRRSDGAPDPDGALKEPVRIKIRHHRLFESTSTC